jgi:hypothetical protein
VPERKQESSYPQEELNGLGAGGACRSTRDVLSDDPEAAVGIVATTVVLFKVSVINLTTANIVFWWMEHYLQQYML